jgi:hypothetical protein
MQTMELILRTVKAEMAWNKFQNQEESNSEDPMEH